MSEKENILLKLLDRSGPKLHGMLYRLTLDADVAEDLMQDLFTRLCELKKPASIKNLEAYACRIAINLAFDRRRKQGSLIRLSETLTDHKTPQVDRQLIRNEELQHILDAAEQLSGLTRECFVLRYIEQMDYDAIAERVQKTTQQVRGLCSKAIQRIRQILNDQNASFYKEAINE